MTIKLPRAAGAREPRWAHLLCGAVEVSPASTSSSTTPSSATDHTALAQRVAVLEQQVALLTQHLETLVGPLSPPSV